MISGNLTRLHRSEVFLVYFRKRNNRRGATITSVNFRGRASFPTRRPDISTLCGKLRVFQRFKRRRCLLAICRVPPLRIAIMINQRVTRRQIIIFGMRSYNIEQARLRPTNVPRRQGRLLCGTISMDCLANYHGRCFSPFLRRFPNVFIRNAYSVRILLGC